MMSFPDTFLHIKLDEWKGGDENSDFFFSYPFNSSHKWKCIFVFRIIAFHPPHPHKPTSRKLCDWLFLDDRKKRGKFFMSLHVEEATRYLFFMCAREIYFQCVIVGREETCENDILSIFALQRDMKVHFLLNEAFSLRLFILISYLSFLRRFLCFLKTSFSPFVDGRKKRAQEGSSSLHGYMLTVVAG